MTKRSLFFFLCVALILAVMFVLQTTSARQESQTVDEGAHLAAGYSYWKTGDFRMNPEHPPLVKLLASVPLLFLPIHLPTDHPSWDERNEWAFARTLLYQNTVDADTILFLGRVPVMVLALALGLLLSIWGRKLWGIAGGLLALMLYAFDPTVLAHSRYVTTDIGVTVFFFATIYFFGRFFDRPSIRRWWPVALFFALAQLAKFSAVILWVILPVLWILRRVASDHRPDLGRRSAVLFFLSLLVVTNLSAFALYGFELKAPLSDPQFSEIYRESEIWNPVIADQQPPLARFVLRLTNPETTMGSALRTGFATFPLPAYSYFRGLSSVVWHNYWGHSSYLLGDFRSTGWWYYFPVAFFVKTPAVTIVLLFLTALYLIRLYWQRIAVYRRRPDLTGAQSALLGYRSADFTYTLLLVPPIIYFLISCTSKINLGIRHLLPIYPFLFLLIGNLVTVRLKRAQWAWRGILVAFLCLFLASAVITYPHYLSYFSEIVGGSENGARYMTDSNLDWGQELKRLGEFTRKHKIPFIYMTYFGQAPMEQYLDDFRYLPTSEEPEKIAALNGWAAISATALFSEDGAYDWLRERHPTEKIGYAIFLYDLRKATE